MRTETSVEARVESLAAVRAFVEEACRRAGAEASACFDLKLAVDEACTNIIEHGYAGQPAGSIALACEADGDGLRVTIVDSGARVRALGAAAGAGPDRGLAERGGSGASAGTSSGIQWTR